MLISYRVENYRSFGQEQKLDMMAGPVRNHPSHILDSDGMGILSAAVVFGANASGKTNLVRSMLDSRSMIVDGTPIGKGSVNRNRSDDDPKAMSFEYVISISGVRYSYGFSVSSLDGSIMEEWLFRSSQSGRKETVFHRTGSEVESDVRMDSKSSNAFSVYKGEASNLGELFLRALSRAKGSDGDVFSSASAVMEWFREGLVIVGAGMHPAIRNIPNERDHLERLVSSYGTGISGIRYERVEPGASGIPKQVLDMISDTVDGSAHMTGPTGRYRITPGSDMSVERMVFDHNGASFDFIEESDGTKRLMDLAPILDPGEGDGITYVVDELDRSLHPQLTRKFMEDFLSISGRCGRQLIITVHESRLMDLNLLRRDEIWFVERGADGSTELFSLEEFSERGDRRIDRAYLNGRYGAVPHFDGRLFDQDME